MTSAASTATFDKYIASMNANDVSRANTADASGRERFNQMQSFYRSMAELGRGGEDVATQSRTMYSRYMDQYRSLGFGDAEAKKQVEQQLGFGEGETASEYTLHQLKDESRRRASEMAKRQSKAQAEQLVQSLQEQSGSGGNA